MNKKIAIVTIESMNYGNRLQNYALQVVLENMGEDVETLRRVKPHNLAEGVFSFFKTALQVLCKTKGSKFIQFDKLIKKSKHYALANEVEDGLDGYYDMFICGSDQIWNPYYSFVGKSDFLFFTEKHKKIAYAASFGINKIEDSVVDEYKSLLNDFKMISVREEQGADIVEELVGKRPNVVLDPTFLINKQDWEKIERRPNDAPDDKYVLLYILGDQTAWIKEKIDQFKKQYQIYNIRALKKNGKEIAIGPSEFLYLIHHAEIVLTDSFHATVFSLIFHKKFYTFNRSGIDMNSRITSLANKFAMEKYLNEKGELNCESNIDYHSFEILLEKERAEAYEYLKDALSR